MNEETLKQIAQMQSDLQEEQISLRKTLVDTQIKIEKNEEDINACAHLLARFNYVYEEEKEDNETQVSSSCYTIAE